MSLNTLQYAHYRFQFKAVGPAQLNPAHGSMLRGAMGNVMRATFCTEGEKTSCEGCYQNRRCLYTQLFYGLATHEIEDQKFDLFKVPNPFVIKPLDQGKTTFEKGESFSFDLVLIGSKTLDYSQYYIYAIMQMERTWLGKKGQMFELSKISDVLSGESMTMASFLNPLNYKRYTMKETPSLDVKSCTVSFLTPVRIKSQGQLVSKLPFELLLKNIIRRYSMFLEAYEGRVFDQDIQALLEKAKTIEIVLDDTYWEKLERLSVRKQAKMSLGGIRGKLVYEGALGQFQPWLEVGRLIHVGKACTNGDGWLEYECENG